LKNASKISSDLLKGGFLLGFKPSCGRAIHFFFRYASTLFGCHGIPTR